MIERDTIARRNMIVNRSKCGRSKCGRVIDDAAAWQHAERGVVRLKKCLGGPAIASSKRPQNEFQHRFLQILKPI
jgi:hypothetical protein